MANSTILYACTADGLFIFNKPGTLPEWLPPRKTLEGRKVGAAWSEPGPPIRVLAVADGALLLSENGGRTWDNVGPQGVGQDNVMGLDFDETTALLRATTEKGGAWVSTDGGATWQVASTEEMRQLDVPDSAQPQLPAGTLASLILPGGAETPPTLVAGTSEGALVSSDNGASWAKVALPHEGSVAALARDPERRDRLYAATSTGFLFESGNRGKNWQAINRESISPVNSLFVLRI